MSEREDDRRTSLQRAAVGSGMLLGGTAANHALNQRLRRHKAPSTFGAVLNSARNRKRGFKAATHLPDLAGRLGTRGLQAVGLPLAAYGAYNAVKLRPEKTRSVNPREVAHNLARQVVLADKVEEGRRHVLGKALTVAEQRRLDAHRQVGRATSLAGGTLGLGALALRSPSAAGVLVRRIPSTSRRLGRLASTQDAATRHSNTLGVLAIGTGAAGSFNYAAQQKLERKKEALAKARLPRYTDEEYSLESQYTADDIKQLHRREGHPAHKEIRANMRLSAKLYRARGEHDLADEIQDTIKESMARHRVAMQGRKRVGKSLTPFKPRIFLKQPKGGFELGSKEDKLWNEAGRKYYNAPNNASRRVKAQYTVVTGRTELDRLNGSSRGDMATVHRKGSFYRKPSTAIFHQLDRGGSTFEVHGGETRTGRIAATAGVGAATLGGGLYATHRVRKSLINGVYKPITAIPKAQRRKVGGYAKLRGVDPRDTAFLAERKLEVPPALRKMKRYPGIRASYKAAPMGMTLRIGGKSGGKSYITGAAPKSQVAAMHAHEMAHASPKRSAYRLHNQIMYDPKKMMREEARADYLASGHFASHSQRRGASAYSLAADTREKALKSPGASYKWSEGNLKDFQRMRAAPPKMRNQVIYNRIKNSMVGVTGYPMKGRQIDEGVDAYRELQHSMQAKGVRGGVHKRDDAFLRDYRDRISPSAEGGYETLRARRRSAGANAVGSASIAGLSGWFLGHELRRKTLSKPAIALTSASMLGSSISALDNARAAHSLHGRMGKIKAKAHAREELGLYGRNRGLAPTDPTSRAKNLAKAMVV